MQPPFTIETYSSYTHWLVQSKNKTAKGRLRAPVVGKGILRRYIDVINLLFYVLVINTLGSCYGHKTIEQKFKNVKVKVIQKRTVMQTNNKCAS